MSGKLIYSLTEENPDLRKQIGCMNVIFQLFNRQHFISGRRASHKRLPPVGQDGNDDKPINTTVEKIQSLQDKNQKKAAAKDKQRISSESSRTSFSSSSCSSTFSSLESNKIAPLETASHGIPPTDVPINQSKQAARQPVDLREAVKESITNREARGLSVHIASKAMGSHTLKHIDSPRPMPLSKSTKPKVSNLNESSRTLNKLREAPRFSYDERESREKTTMKPKEVPRLSLDSRVNTKKAFNPQEETGSRPSSIVAKLMGLDVLTSPKSRNDVKIGLGNPYLNQDIEYCNSKSPRNSQLSVNSPSLKNADSLVKLNVSLRIPIEQAPWKQTEGSRGSQKPASKHQEPAKKFANSYPSVYGEIEKRLTDLEFKKSGKDLRALKQILEAMQKSKETVQTKQREQSPDATYQACSSPSLRDRDQNAILAIQRNLPSKSPSHLKNTGSPIVIMKPATLVRKSNNPPLMTIRVEGLSGLRKLSAALADKNGLVEKQTYNDRTSRDNLQRTSNRVSTEKNFSPRTRTPQASNGTQQMTVKSPRSPGALSPKLQRRQPILDKQSRPTTPSSESSRPIKQTRGHSLEVNSMQSDDQLSDMSTNTRCLSHQGDAISAKSESNASFLSEIDADVSSSGNSEEMINTFSQQGGQKLKTSIPELSAYGSMAELATPEQPSPVSVLDSMFYKDDLPSPVKKIPYSFQDDATWNCDEPVWTSANLHLNSDSTISSLSFGRDQKKLENLEHLVQKIEQLNSPRSETPTDGVTSLVMKDNEDHHYISAILLASGLLSRDIRSSLMTIQLHPAGYLINPDLFLVLEQSYAKKLSNDHNRKVDKSKLKDNIHRKLVFDVVNEMLVSKVVSKGSIEPWVSLNKTKGRISNGHQLTKELCTEIDQLQPNNLDSSLEDDCDIFERILSEDLRQQSSTWTDFGSDVSSLVLDIERLIFKDLVTEVVDGKATGLRARYGGHSRKLFAM